MYEPELTIHITYTETGYEVVMYSDGQQLETYQIEDTSQIYAIAEDWQATPELININEHTTKTTRKYKIVDMTKTINKLIHDET